MPQKLNSYETEGLRKRVTLDSLRVAVCSLRTIKGQGRIALFMCVLPLMAAVETSLRGSNHVVFFKDIVVEFLAVWPVALTTLFIFCKGFRIYFTLIFFTVLSSRIWFITRKKRRLVLRLPLARVFRHFAFRATEVARSLVQSFVTVAIYFTAFYMSFAWWWFVDSQVYLSALVSLGVLVLFISFRNTNKNWARFVWIILSLLGLLGPFASNIVHFLTARQVKGELLLAEPAYDVVSRKDGVIVAALYDKENAVVIGRNGSTLPIPGTYYPQRLAVDQITNKVFIANFRYMLGPTSNHLTVWREDCLDHVNLNGCWASIDVMVVDSLRKVLMICESGYVYLIDINSLLVEAYWRLPFPLYPLYAIAVDEGAGRVYITAESLYGLISVIDLPQKKVIDSKWLGSVTLGVRVDERNGNIWAARALANEVVVLDRNLKITNRIKVGPWPRDMEIDYDRGVIIVGNYTSGTITVIDLDSKKELDCFRITSKARIMHRHRGVAIGHDGSWLISCLEGIFRVKPTVPTITARAEKYIIP